MLAAPLLERDCKPPVRSDAYAQAQWQQEATDQDVSLTTQEPKQVHLPSPAGIRTQRANHNSTPTPSHVSEAEPVSFLTIRVDGLV